MTEQIVDRSEARRRRGLAYGEWYWARAHGKPQAERVNAILEYRHWRKLHLTAPAERNERGNEIYRDEDADRKLGLRGQLCRYPYDERLCRAGWRQYDTEQDASYFGVWVSIEKLMTFTYAEGDRILVVCPDRAHLKAELDDAAQFYGPPPPAWVCLDQDETTKQWTRTDVYDPRPTVDDECV